MLVCVADVWGAVDPFDPSTLRYAKLVEIVRAGDMEERRQFAQIALAALIEANRVEIRRARELHAENTRSLSRWEIGAQAYVADLEKIASEVAQASEVDIIREAYGVVRLTVQHSQVILSAPRLSLQRSLDLTILDAACGVMACTEETSLGAEVAAQTRDVQREWSFSDQVPPMLSASDGLHCVFVDAQHLPLKEIACDSLMHELRLTAEGLRSIVQQGTAVDWGAFKIIENGASSQQVIYDTAGANFDLSLPYLSQSEDVWRDAIPWLQARLRGYRATYMFKVPQPVAYLPPE